MWERHFSYGFHPHIAPHNPLPRPTSDNLHPAVLPDNPIPKPKMSDQVHPDTTADLTDTTKTTTERDYSWKGLESFIQSHGLLVAALVAGVLYLRSTNR